MEKVITSGGPGGVPGKYPQQGINAKRKPMNAFSATAPNKKKKKKK